VFSIIELLHLYEQLAIVLIIDWAVFEGSVVLSAKSQSLENKPIYQLISTENIMNYLYFKYFWNVFKFYGVREVSSFNDHVCFSFFESSSFDYKCHPTQSTLKQKTFGTKARIFVHCNTHSTSMAMARHDGLT
jgi:hypothetical protein